jgi:hypothetical protein
LGYGRGPAAPFCSTQIPASAYFALFLLLKKFLPPLLYVFIEELYAPTSKVVSLQGIHPAVFSYIVLRLNTTNKISDDKN